MSGPESFSGLMVEELPTEAGFPGAGTGNPTNQLTFQCHRDSESEQGTLNIILSNAHRLKKGEILLIRLFNRLRNGLGTCPKGMCLEPGRSGFLLAPGWCPLVLPENFVCPENFAYALAFG